MYQVALDWEEDDWCWPSLDSENMIDESCEVTDPDVAFSRVFRALQTGGDRNFKPPSGATTYNELITVTLNQLFTQLVLTNHLRDSVRHLRVVLGWMLKLS